MLKKLLFIFLFFLLIFRFLIFSQQYNYKELIEILSSDTLYGRGYVNNGVNKSAEIIKNKFKNFDILPLFNDSYFQHFDILVNTFPGIITLNINNVECIPGIDFLIDPESPSIKGKYKVITLKSGDVFNLKNLAKKIRASKNKFICLDFRDDSIYNDSLKNILDQTRFLIENKKGMPYRGVIKLTNKKLTWNISQRLNNIPILEVYNSKSDYEIKEIFLNIENNYFTKYEVKNIGGLIEGTLYTDSFIILCAHYDHIGMMGQKTYFPGANDNASGVAMIMCLADYFRRFPSKFSIIFLFLAAEEVGLKGAEYFYNNMPVAKEKIKFLINLDLVGTGENGIAVVNALKYNDLFKKLLEININNGYFEYIKERGEACNGDHCIFDKGGIKCFYIYTLGNNKFYHDINDKFENLSLAGFEKLLNLIINFINNF